MTETPCEGFQEVLKAYNRTVSQVKLSGPTNFAPLIQETLNIVRKEKQYHILIIIADGEVTQVQDTKRAIVEASQYPLSIICVGVGDGPFDLMHQFDHELEHRAFDNFRFVNFHAIMHSNPKNPEIEFARMALMEIPDQFQAIRKLGLLDSTSW